MLTIKSETVRVGKRFGEDPEASDKNSLEESSLGGEMSVLEQSYANW